MDNIRPHLACDVDLSTLTYPLIGLPKVDGVRGMHIKSATHPEGKFTGRSLKEFKNPSVGQRFKAFNGFDGELALGDIHHPRLCSLTTGFVNRKTAREGKPTESDELVLWVFDLLTDHTTSLPYIDRLKMLGSWIERYNEAGYQQVKAMPWRVIENEEQLLAFDEENLEAGFEGSIFRDLQGLHYSGRASTKGKRPNAYLRLKQFVDFEGRVEEILEAKENTNEKKTNELGNSERSTHQENMIPKGMVGTIVMSALTDVPDPVTKAILIKKGQWVDVGPGNMPHDQRTALWRAYTNSTSDCIVGQIGKAKFFPRGQKDLPRFPTFVCLRAEEDMSEG